MGLLLKRLVRMLSVSRGWTVVNRCVPNWSLRPQNLVLGRRTQFQVLYIGRRLSPTRRHWPLMGNAVCHSLRKSHTSSLLNLPQPRLSRLFQNMILVPIRLVFMRRELAKHIRVQKLAWHRIHQPWIRLFLGRCCLLRLRWCADRMLCVSLAFTPPLHLYCVSNIPFSYFSFSAASLNFSNLLFSYSRHAPLPTFILPNNSYGPLTCARRTKKRAKFSKFSVKYHSSGAVVL
jgi:hypothetical protein